MRCYADCSAIFCADPAAGSGRSTGLVVRFAAVTQRDTMDVMRGRAVKTVAAVVVLAGVCWGKDLNLPGHGQGRPRRPQRIAGGESFPPLPLPATPLRRTERKREPSPPALLAKLNYADDWYNVTNDVRNLLRWARGRIGIAYRPITLKWRKFEFDPAAIPIVYLTGHEPIGDLDERQRSLLRRFVYEGGTILANACCGNAEFRDSFRRQIATVFPGRELYRLPPQHPIFHCRHDIEQVRYQKGTSQRVSGPPLLEGIDVGCRTAVIFAPVDLASGWYGQDPPDNFPPGAWIVGGDARKLGANILTYVLSNLQYARLFAVSDIRYDVAEESPGSLAIAQVVHGGDWDPNPSALPRLLRFVRDNTTLAVRFERHDVAPADPRIFDYPLLYMVGHNDFQLADAEVTNLRKYLAGGGVLLAEACCGRIAFDQAFRRELKRVLPQQSLQPLPADHPLFDINFRIGAVHLSPLAQKRFGELDAPLLEVIQQDGDLKVVYSPLGIANGWEDLPHAYSAGYDPADALKLGVNIITYVMSH